MCFFLCKYYYEEDILDDDGFFDLIKIFLDCSKIVLVVKDGFVFLNESKSGLVDFLCLYVLYIKGSD